MAGNRGGRRRKASRGQRANDNDNDTDISQSNRNKRGAESSEQQDGVEGTQPKRHLQRLTAQQIQVLEGFFGLCAHPDENQRMGLSVSTGLSMQQVKFWFQNKRTQVKHLTGNEENYRVKAENEMLKHENEKLKLAMKNIVCPSCVDLPAKNLSGEIQMLKEENELLKQQIAQLHAEAHPSSNHHFQLDSSRDNTVARKNDLDTIAELAQNAIHEFVILSESNGPLWMPVVGGFLEILNKMAYAQAFGGKSSANIIGFKTEATRAEAMVMMDAKQIVEYIMDPECYTSFCPGILSSAKTTHVYKWPTNVGYNGAMHLMTMEMLFPSPLVPSRKCTFVRCCKEMPNGTVIIVDVSLDNGDGTFFRCRKMPSGVVIRAMRPDICKVTVIEHVQVDDTGVHELYRPCLSGLMFGARRWATSIVRQCARMRDLFHVTKNVLSANINGRKTLMKLADDLLVNYTRGIAAVPGDPWTILRGAGMEDDIKVAYRRNDDANNSAIVSVSASFRLPMPLRVTYDLLKNNLLRPKWDVLVNGGVVREEVTVCNGVEVDDVVSILHVKPALENRESMMILQNSCYDVSGSFIVYCPMDSQLMDEIMRSGGMAESKVPIYPTGFSLLPVGESAQGGAGLDKDGATLVTVGFQIMLKLARGTELNPRSVFMAIGLMSQNIATIKRTLTNTHPIFQRGRQPPNLR